jgi:hypothetical protein
MLIFQGNGGRLIVWAFLLNMLVTETFLGKSLLYSGKYWRV